MIVIVILIVIVICVVIVYNFHCHYIYHYQYRCRLPSIYLIVFLYRNIVFWKSEFGNVRVAVSIARFTALA